MTVCHWCATVGSTIRPLELVGILTAVHVRPVPPSMQRRPMCAPADLFYGTQVIQEEPNFRVTRDRCTRRGRAGVPQQPQGSPVGSPPRPRTGTPGAGGGFVAAPQGPFLASWVAVKAAVTGSPLTEQCELPTSWTQRSRRPSSIAHWGWPHRRRPGSRSLRRRRGRAR